MNTIIKKALLILVIGLCALTYTCTAQKDMAPGSQYNDHIEIYLT